MSLLDTLRNIWRHFDSQSVLHTLYMRVCVCAWVEVCWSDGTASHVYGSALSQRWSDAAWQRPAQGSLQVWLSLNWAGFRTRRATSTIRHVFRSDWASNRDEHETLKPKPRRDRDVGLTSRDKTETRRLLVTWRHLDGPTRTLCTMIAVVTLFSCPLIWTIIMHNIKL